MSIYVKKVGEESIHHFSHRHELFLTLRPINEGYGYYSPLSPCCKACGKVNEEYYSCWKCAGDDKFHMHMWCAQLPKKLKHPFHENHLLTLVDDPPWRWRWRSGVNIRCDACGDSCNDFAYKCSEGCEFYMDMKCAMLLPTTNLVAKHKKLHHPRPLFVCQRKVLLHCSSNTVAAAFRCGGCSMSFDINEEEPDYSTIIYVCFECSALLHESCADLPQEIRHHPLHQHCTATSLAFSIIPSDGSTFICDFCKLPGRLFFKCSVCSIKMNIRCALLTSSTTTTTENKMNNIGHPHPLIHCNDPISHRSARLCGGCNNQMVDSTCYYCYTCRVFLDESCAQMPGQIQHPFHQDHPLFLICPSASSRCKFCDTFGRKFAYKCHPCNFTLDLRCSSPPLYPMLNVPQLHPHPLAYKNKNIRGNICDVFSCIQCDYYESVRNFRLLPPTIKSPWHRHPLTLVRDLVEQYPDVDKLYCQVCELELVSPLYQPWYVCGKCDLVSHFHCVLSEVMDYLDEKATLVEELAGGTKLLHLFFDNDSGALITPIMDMNDGDFKNLLCEIDKEIDFVNAASVQCTQECEILNAQVKKKKSELEEERAKLDGKEKECRKIDGRLKYLRSNRNIFVKLRSNTNWV